MPTVRLVVFLVTYFLIAAQRLPFPRLNRPAAALLGAVAMVVVGGLPLREAYAAVDMDVIVFLLGVLLVTAHLEVGGFFEWAAGRVVRRLRTPRALLAALVALSGVLSAFFINDTLCLVLTPLALATLRPLGLRPLPFLLAIALSSNVGSAMAITGNPQNMLIGVASGIPYGRFLATLALPSLGGLAIVYLVVARLCRADLDDASRVVAAPGGAAAPPPLLDPALVVKALLVFGGALAGWLAGAPLPLVAVVAGAVMLAVAGRDPAEALARVEWPLLLFFAALFVVMRGVRDLSIVASLTGSAAARLTGEPWRDAGVVSAAMVALSNLVSNVPAVILWLPVVPRLPHADFVWLVMAMSSTFAGNLTILGSMANLIVAERAKARGENITFWQYARVGIPVTLLTLAWGVAWLALVSARHVP
ncbi:MAG: SLC13 family permease [Gemmatimonadaceae bacterium]